MYINVQQVRGRQRQEDLPSESCRYRRLMSSAVELYSISRISYGLRNPKSSQKDMGKDKCKAYLSLKAFRIRSTSSSRCKAVASRFRTFSRSSMDGTVGGGGIGFELEEDEDMVAVLVVV